MRHWCSNQIFITGPDPVLDTLLAAAGQPQADTDPQKHTPQKHTPQHPPRQKKSLAFSLDALIPTPKALLEGQGWYNWRLKHWGTEWDLEDPILDRGPGIIEIACLSAWAPPLTALRRISERYPGLSIQIRFEEPLMELFGEVLIEKGRMFELA